MRITTEPNHKKYIEILKKISGEKRMQIGFELLDMAVSIMIAGIKTQKPGISEIEIQKEVVRRIMICHKRNSLRQS